MIETQFNRANIVRLILLGAAIMLLAVALLYNEYSLAPLAHDEFAPLTRYKIRGVQLGFALAGALLIAISEALRRSQSLARLISGRAPEIALLVLAGLLPVAIVDFGLRPFVVAKTSLFVADPQLGWRMRPNVEAEWGGVRVATNASGLRGPDVAYAKPADVFRILFLGDSVAFGYGIERTDDVFPFRAGRQFATALRTQVEVVNASVGGYSPWQERIYLESEGLRYAPDLIVVCFVLNDVAEKLELARFGGSGQGWQLARSARGELDRWLSASALATTMRDGWARLRFGDDVRLGAQAVEETDVRRVADSPKLDRVIERAWEITLGNLAGLLDTAQANRIPALIVVLPFSYQLDLAPEQAEPQRRLEQFARARGTPMLDLLPLFSAADSPQQLMLDAAHLTSEGHALTANAIADHVMKLGLVGSPAQTAGEAQR